MRLAVALVLLNCVAGAQTASRGAGVAITNPLRQEARPFNFGGLLQGGFGVTEDRGGFKFFMAGAHAGKVLTGNSGGGMMRGNFEVAM